MPRLPPLSLILDLARTESPDDPFAFRFAPQTYTLRRADGGIARLDLAWSRELLADLEALRRPESDPALRQRLGDLLARFVEPAGWRERAAEIAGVLAGGRAVHLTIRSAAAELYALPWEVLTLGSSGVSLAEHPGLLVRYAWPATTSAPESPSPRPTGGRILYAWSAAGGEVPAAEHQRAIEAAAPTQDLSFEAGRDVVAHASLARLQAALADPSAPTSVVHLLVHGGARGSTFGLLLDGDGDGEAAMIDAAALRRALGPAAGSLRLVVLAACQGGDAGELGNHLGSVAQALHRAGIQAVVASRSPLSIAGSIVLSEALYAGILGGPASLEAAFLVARARLGAERCAGDGWSVQLYARPEDGDDTRPIVLRPYRGLLAFGADQSRFFFGRDGERQEILRDLVECIGAGKPRLLLVAGASGSGKSSLVLAAAIPDILGGAGPWPQARWVHAVIRPGEAPMIALEEALARHSERAGPLLLVVDQFEEVFTHVAAAAERQAFARRLWALARDDTGVVCILTVRVDFLGRSGELVLDDAGGRLDRLAYDPAHLVLVCQMEPAQLRAVIEGPAALVGLELQEGLAARLLADAGAEPGALPLLQYTLDRLWERRDGPVLRLAAYEALGGVAGALESRAEELYAAMPAGPLRQVRRLFLRLVHLDDEGGALTRRRADLPALRPRDPVDDADFDAALAGFIDARLLVQGQRGQAITVEVAHEALVRSWSRLRGWIDEDRAKIGDLAKLEGWAHEWRVDRVLLMGNQLAYARQVADRYADELTPEIRELLGQSVRRARFYAWLARGAVLSLLATVIVAAVVYRGHALEAERQREQIQVQRDYLVGLGRDLLESRARIERGSAIGEARRLAQAIDRGDPRHLDRSLLIGVEALRATADHALPPEPQALTGLYSVIAYRPQSVALTGATAPLIELALGRDDRRILGRTEAGVVHLWDLDGDGDGDDPRAPRIRESPVGFTVAALSPDGARLALGDGGPLRIEPWDGDAAALVLPERAGELLGFTGDGEHVVTQSGDRVLRWSARAVGPAEVVDRQPGLIYSALARGGRALITIGGANDAATVRITDLGGGAPSIAFVTRDRPQAVDLIDGDRALVWAREGFTLRQRNGEGTLFIRQLDGFEGTDGKVSPDGRYAALLGADGRLLHVDLEVGDLEAAIVLRGPGPRVPFGFTADGRWLVVADDRGALTLRPASGVGPLVRAEGHQAPITSLAFAERGDAFVSGADDRSVRRWRARSPVPGAIAVRGPASALRFTADGRQVIAALADGIDVIVADGRGERVRLDTAGAATSCLDLDDAGRLLVAVEPGGITRVWALARADAPRRIDPAGPVERGCADLSADGRRLLTGIGGARLRVHDLERDGEAVTQTITHDRPVLSAMFTNDRRIVGVDARALLLWPADGGAPLVRELAAGVARGSPLERAADGARVLVVHDDGSISVWSLAAAAPPIVLRLADHFFTRAIFGADGREVIAGGGGSLVRFDLTEVAAPQVLRGHTRDVSVLEIAGDGRLISADVDGHARIWSGERAAEIELRAGALAGALSPDGRTLALALADQVELWPVDPAALVDLACDLAGRDLDPDEWAALMTSPYRRSCGDAGARTGRAAGFGAPGSMDD